MTPPSTSDPVLRIEHLGRVVKDKVLVEDATFEVRTGEVLAIVGGRRRERVHCSGC